MKKIKDFLEGMWLMGVLIFLLLAMIITYPFNKKEYDSLFNEYDDYY